MLARRKEEYDYEEHEEYELPDSEPIGKPHLRAVVKTRTLLDKPLRTRCQTMFAIFTVLAMLVTIRSGICASHGYALVATQQEAQALEQENERLRIEIARLKSPERIKHIAETELGMHVSSKTYFAH